MLCISRYNDKGDIWVYDTVSGKEKLYSEAGITLKIAQGKEIKGLRVNEDGSWKVSQYIFDKSPRVAQAVLVKHVHHQCIDGRLVYAEPFDVDEIVLSEYATVLGKASIVIAPGIRYIFDNKITHIDVGVFRNEPSSRFAIGCSELSDTVALSLYESLRPGMAFFEDRHDRSYSMRSIAAIKSFSFVRLYRIKPAWQDFAKSVLYDLIVPYYPKGKVLSAIKDYLDTIFKDYTQKQWEYLTADIFMSYLTPLQRWKGLSEKSYKAFIMAIIYLYMGGDCEEIQSQVNKTFDKVLLQRSRYTDLTGNSFRDILL